MLPIFSSLAVWEVTFAIITIKERTAGTGRAISTVCRYWETRREDRFIT